VPVAPHDEHIEELQFQVATVGFTADGNTNQIGSLVVQAVGHVEISFSQRIALIQVDRGVTADRVFGSDVARGCGSRSSTTGTESGTLVAAALLNEERTVISRGRKRANG
jgi:hypothetical protein